MAGGLDMIHVPYKGFGQGLADVLAGQVPMIFSGPTAAIQIVKSGKLKALGVTGKTRIRAMLEVPPIADDFADYEIIFWCGFLAPAGTPRDIVNKVHADVVAIVKRPEFQERLIRDGMDSIANTPQEFAAQIKADLVRWSRIVKASGVTLD